MSHIKLINFRFPRNLNLIDIFISFVIFIKTYVSDLKHIIFIQKSITRKPMTIIYGISDLIKDITRVYYNEETKESKKTIQIPLELLNITADIKQTEEIEDVFEIVKPSKLQKYKPNIWSITEYIHSSYQKKYNNKKTTKLKMKMEKAEKLKFCNIKPKTLAKALTMFDINFLKAIHASELYYYGKDNCPSINAWIKHNTTVQNMTIQNMNPAYFIAVAEELKKLKNYNTMTTVITAVKNAKLSEQMFKQISSLIEYDNYFKMREQIDNIGNESMIVPIDLFLKDIEECNRNLDSEIASKRFIKQIDFFTCMQEVNSEKEKRLQRKLEHFLVVNLFKCINIVVERKPEKLVKITHGSFFLFL